MRFAIFGCGSIGQRHLRNLKTLGCHDLLLYDPDTDHLEKVSCEFQAHPCSTKETIWAQAPDVVLITAPTNQHITLACEAAEHKCHLFIEKPLSHTLQGIDRLQAIVKQHQLITMVGCNMRFHKGPAQVSQLINQGAIGQPISARLHTGSYLPGWRPDTDYTKSYSASAKRGGGAIFDQIHEIDLALWFFGPVKRVSAMIAPANPININAEGLAEILLAHNNGVLSSVHLNFIQHNYRRYCEIIGQNGSIEWDFDRPEVRVYTNHAWQTIAIDDDWDQIFVDELAYFISCLNTGSETFSSLAQGRDALSVGLAAKTAAKEGTIVPLKDNLS